MMVRTADEARELLKESKDTLESLRNLTARLAAYTDLLENELERRDSKEDGDG